MFSTIKGYLYTFIAFVFILLSGAFFYQKKRADSKAQEVEDLEDEMQANDITNEVKSFETINKERKEGTDEKVKTTHTHIEPTTTYRL